MNTRCNFNYLLGKILFEGVLFGKYIKRKLFHNIKIGFLTSIVTCIKRKILL